MTGGRVGQGISCNAPEIEWSLVVNLGLLGVAIFMALMLVFIAWRI